MSPRAQVSPTLYFKPQYEPFLSGRNSVNNAHDTREMVKAREQHRHEMLLKKHQNHFAPGVQALEARARTKALEAYKNRF